MKGLTKFEMAFVNILIFELRRRKTFFVEKLVKFLSNISGQFKFSSFREEFEDIMHFLKLM